MELFKYFLKTDKNDRQLTVEAERISDKSSQQTKSSLLVLTIRLKSIWQENSWIDWRSNQENYTSAVISLVGAGGKLSQSKSSSSYTSSVSGK